MRIGIISDTHIPSMAAAPPDEVKQAFEGVDMIFHAGHAYTSDVITWLSDIAPVEWTESAMQGGGEDWSHISRLEVLELEGHVIGLTHELILVSLGDELLPGSIDREWPKNESLPDALTRIFGRELDIVVFGYTHQAMVEEHQGVLFVNPGSPNLVRQEVRLGTVAILDITPDSREARIVDLSALGANGA
jgi:putative phosphoesterase